MVSYKYANKGTALYQMELLAASVFEHALKSEREEALKPKREFDDIMEALSGASPRRLYRPRVSSRPGPIFPGGEPARGDLAAQYRLAPGAALRRALARRSPRHPLGVRLGAEPPHHHRLVWRRLAPSIACSRCAASRARRCCRACSSDSRLFRLIIDEVEKTLLLVDLDIARDYASLVAGRGRARHDLAA